MSNIQELRNHIGRVYNISADLMDKVEEILNHPDISLKDAKIAIKELNNYTREYLGVKKGIKPFPEIEG